MDAVTQVPTPANEPVRQYAPGSAERRLSGGVSRAPNWGPTRVMSFAVARSPRTPNCCACSVVVITILAAMAFDPRLMWDVSDDRSDGSRPIRV